jgi:hypothetical protein
MICRKFKRHEYTTARYEPAPVMSFLKADSDLNVIKSSVPADGSKSRSGKFR